MQVRFANRQDEKGIRELAEALSGKAGVSLDLKGSDSDLVNIDANYFGKHGLFLVVENEGTIEGYAGAKELGQEVLQITRFYLSEKLDLDDIACKMLRIIVEFAPRLLYSSIECDTKVDVSTLERFHFKRQSKDEPFKLAITPDF